MAASRQQNLDSKSLDINNLDNEPTRREPDIEPPRPVTEPERPVPEIPPDKDTPEKKAPIKGEN
jgi:hypothetical protein